MSSSPTPTFDETLQSITAVKLNEIEKQRVAYEEVAAGIFAAKEKAAKAALVDDKESLLQRVELLIAAVKQWKGAGKLLGTTVGGKLELGNLEFWMKQAREEVGFDIKIIRGWEETLEAHVRHTSNRLGMAKLSGDMYLEFLASGDSNVPYYGGMVPGVGGSGDGIQDEDFDMLADAPGEHARRPGNQPSEDAAERKASIAKEEFISTVFEEHPISFSNLFSYLDNLFEPEEVAQALAEVRASNYRFGLEFDMGDIRHNIHNILENLLASGLMSEQQRVVIKHIQGNSAAREQVVSISNMRMANIDTWAWPKEGVKVRMRRDTSDDFCAFTDPEIIDAIVLQHIGTTWKAQLKMACTQFFNSKAWKRVAPSIVQEIANNKVNHLIGQSSNAEPYVRISINDFREHTFKRVFFLSSLNDFGRPNSHNDFVNMVETDTSLRDNQSMVAARRKVLHLMAAESRLNNLIHGSHAMVHSIIENLTSSLPHESILVILAYLGVPQKWINFFQAFLSVPMVLPGETTPRVCKRGMPIGYAASAFFGEAILFTMDVAVNRRTKGSHLYRIHDEMWFWNSDVKKCVKAWKVMSEYAAIVGLKFDDKATGAVYAGPPNADALLLPKGEVKWGLLKFDSGALKFVVDQTEVDQQIAEFRRRLSATKSVLGWVHIYNKCMAHLSRHFGGIPVNGLGSAFIDDLIKTFKRVQNELFDGSNLGPIGYLRNRVCERFGIHDLPDGYFYLPTAIGGLQLFNPTLLLSALQTSFAPSNFNRFRLPPSGFMSSIVNSTLEVENVPIDSRLSRQFFSDLSNYQALKSRWEQPVPMGQNEVGGRGEFISFHEFVALRETGLATWGSVYNEMFNTPSAQEVARVQVGKNLGRADSTLRLERRGHNGLYTRWVEALYGEDVANKFGSLDVVDQSLILADIL